MAISQVFDAALSVFGVRTAEEPAYQVIDHVGEVEIRRYAPRFAAETTVKANNVEAINQAFYILAGYIFGGNQKKQDIAMTAPVALERSESIPITAPVVTEANEAGALTMRFFLPQSVTQANAPAPTDARVKLVQIPEETIAALRFTSSWSEEAIEGRRLPLTRALQGSSWAPMGKSFTQLYDPPFTIPFLRRNEVAIRVTLRSG